MKQFGPSFDFFCVRHQFHPPKFRLLVSFLNHQNGESSHATDVVVSTTPRSRSSHLLDTCGRREDLLKIHFWRQWMGLVPSLLVLIWVLTEPEIPITTSRVIVFTYSTFESFVAYVKRWRPRRTSNTLARLPCSVRPTHTLTSSMLLQPRCRLLFEGKRQELRWERRG